MQKIDEDVQDVFNFPDGEGKLIFNYPKKISRESFYEMTRWLELVRNKIARGVEFFNEKPHFEPTDLPPNAKYTSRSRCGSVTIEELNFSINDSCIRAKDDEKSTVSFDELWRYNGKLICKKCAHNIKPGIISSYSLPGNKIFYCPQDICEYCDMDVNDYLKFYGKRLCVECCKNCDYRIFSTPRITGNVHKACPVELCEFCNKDKDV